MLKIGAYQLKITSAGDMSQATVTAGPFDVRSALSSCVQAVWTGAPIGSLQLQGCLGFPSSNNTGPDTEVFTPLAWTNLGTAVSVSGAGNYIWDIGSSGISAVQIIYTKTSGTGTLTVLGNLKG